MLKCLEVFLKGLLIFFLSVELIADVFDFFSKFFVLLFGSVLFLLFLLADLLLNLLEIASPFLQKRYNIHLPVFKGKIKRCLAFNLQTDVGSTFHQIFNKLKVALLCSHMQNRISIWIFYVRTSSFGKEQLVNFFIFEINCQNQRSKARAS